MVRRPPVLDKIEIQFIPEPSSAVSGLEAGDLDRRSLACDAFRTALHDPDVVCRASPKHEVARRGDEHARPPWDDIDARLAIAKAIDPQGFVDKAFFGLAIAVGAIAPAFGWAYFPPDQVEKPQAFNMDEAGH